jgi:hypothetical protein
MDLKDRTLERIVSNENTVTQLESLHNILREELGGCSNYCLSGGDCRKYGIDIASLTSAVLAAFYEVKFKNNTK